MEAVLTGGPGCCLLVKIPLPEKKARRFTPRKSKLFGNTIRFI